MKKIEYKPEMCECCGQSKTYILSIDRGTVHILKQIAKAIKVKGINCVHLSKELHGAYLTHHEIGNISRPLRHGLVAHVEGEHMASNYCLTNKGLSFLDGQRVAKHAIISKVEGRQIGYFEPETYYCSIHDFDDEGEFWEGVGYEIREGRVIHAPRT